MLREPLEIQYWFVNVFSGSWDIFSLVSMLCISTLCAMFRMQTGSFMVMLVIYAAILFAAGQQILLILAILILGPILFMITRRITD
jgi:cell division protein FtsW (lipid II flippase)